MKPFITFQTPAGNWHIGVALDGKLYHRPIGQGLATAARLANSMDTWYQGREKKRPGGGREWIRSEIHHGFLAQFPDDHYVYDGRKGWRSRQTEIKARLLKARL